MPQTVVYIDDKKVDYRKAAVSVFDYTLHCGIGLFESILAVDDRLILLDEHLDRMEMGIKRLGLDNLRYNRKRIKSTLRRAARNHPDKVKKTKVLLTQGYSQMWPGSKPKPKSIVIVTGHRLQFKKQKLMLSPMRITTANPLQGVKTLNYMTEWMSQRQAVESGYDQGIIINQRGHISETGSANIFMVKNGQMFTPPVSSGALPGIMRSEILRLAKLHGIPCHEKSLTPKKLSSADEIFTTSSFKLVWPVVELKLNGRTHKFPPGPTARFLFDELKAEFTG
ncbi:MAG: aminotransferase class IV [candidate division Zixibacteria bacterium]